MPALSIVIPAYNEAANLPMLLERCARAFEGAAVELILVDNGSTDSTASLLAELVPAHPFARTVRVAVNQGYGFGIASGLRSARGTILAWTHADMQTDPGDALRALSMFERAPDPTRMFVKGRRLGRPAADVFFTAGMAIFESLLLRRWMWDINAQPTVFHRSFFESWSSPPVDFSLDLYAYYLAASRGLAIQRFPVRFGERAHGSSHWNVSWRSKVRFIRRTLDYSLQLRRTLGAG